MGGRSSADPRLEIGGGRHVDGVVSGRSSAHPGLWVGRPGGRHVDGVVVGGPQRTRGVGRGKKRVRAPARGEPWLVLVPSLRPWVSDQVSRRQEWGEGVLTRRGGGFGGLTRGEVGCVTWQRERVVLPRPLRCCRSSGVVAGQSGPRVVGHGDGVAVVGPAACAPAPLVSVPFPPACFPCLSFPYRASRFLTVPLVLLWCSAVWGGWRDVVRAGV